MGKNVANNFERVNWNFVWTSEENERNRRRGKSVRKNVQKVVSRCSWLIKGVWWKSEVSERQCQHLFFIEKGRQLAADSWRFRLSLLSNPVGPNQDSERAVRECPLINKGARARNASRYRAMKQMRLPLACPASPNLATTRNFRGIHEPGILSSISRVSRSSPISYDHSRTNALSTRDHHPIHRSIDSPDRYIRVRINFLTLALSSNKISLQGWIVHRIAHRTKIPIIWKSNTYFIIRRMKKTGNEVKDRPRG